MIIKSTVFGNVFRRDTALPWSIFTKLYPFACERRQVGFLVSVDKITKSQKSSGILYRQQNTWIILSPGWRTLDAGPSGWTLVTNIPWKKWDKNKYYQHPNKARYPITRTGKTKKGKETRIWIYIVIWTKGISATPHSSWYTETQLWILLHFHTDLKHTHMISFTHLCTLFY